MKVANWGNYPKVDCEMRSFNNADYLTKILTNWDTVIARGMGRSYGDASLNTNILSTLKLNRILEFDNKTGLITCESGVTLYDLVEIFVPRGWFLSVTPGTKFITVGGAIAADVHGKNHHKEGTFVSPLVSFDLLTHNGDVKTCSREENSELFWLTCGGMGLTGIILHATFFLKPISTAYIRQETLRARNLKEIMDLYEESGDWTYTMSWIDCLAKGKNRGRSLLMRGELATEEDLKRHKQKKKDLLQLPKKQNLSVPFFFPEFALNSLSMKIFNFFVYRKSPKRVKESIINIDSFFYPLDAIHHWNRIYGKRGIIQHQCVLPKDVSEKGLDSILSFIAEEGFGSFLSVLKLFGKQKSGPLSFPMEGYTLALDFPIKKGIFDFLEELDKRVLEYGGRLYLAKDARMSKEMFWESYANIADIIKKISTLNQSKFCSFQSNRLQITS